MNRVPSREPNDADVATLKTRTHYGGYVWTPDSKRTARCEKGAIVYTDVETHRSSKPVRVAALDALAADGGTPDAIANVIDDLLVTTGDLNQTLLTAATGTDQLANLFNQQGEPLDGPDSEYNIVGMTLNLQAYAMVGAGDAAKAKKVDQRQWLPTQPQTTAGDIAPGSRVC